MPEPAPVVIDPKTTRLNLATVVIVLAGSIAIWREVDGLGSEVSSVATDVREIKSTQAKHGDLLTAGAISDARMESRIRQLERDHEELKRRLEKLENGK